MSVGLACGMFNGFWIARVGLNSLVVTLAMLICYRGLARVFLEDKSIGKFPEWFNTLGQQKPDRPVPAGAARSSSGCSSWRSSSCSTRVSAARST